MLTPEKAMVLLSFRHLSDDHFWFTLFHEFAHLLLHNNQTFIDTDDTEVDQR
ncbi:ImmA/IrrE family metallo-endopeptidase, partial [Acinetobacter baumannii]